jgi:hypothetical protein
MSSTASTGILLVARTIVLTAAELAALRDAYRSTSLQDVAALNARPSFQPERAG